jgi:hypothetical protein
MEMYRDAIGLFGFADAIHARNILNPSKWLEIRIYLEI